MQEEAEEVISEVISEAIEEIEVAIEDSSLGAITEEISKGVACDEFSNVCIIVLLNFCRACYKELRH